MRFLIEALYVSCFSSVDKIGGAARYCDSSQRSIIALFLQSAGTIDISVGAGSRTTQPVRAIIIIAEEINFILADCGVLDCGGT